jgi:NAD(P)H dehydrogenase (quinone)
MATTSTTPNAAQDTLALIGRLLIAWLFIPAGFGKIAGFAGTVGYITSAGLPLPEVAAASPSSSNWASASRCWWASRPAGPPSGPGDLHRRHRLFFHNFWSMPEAQQMMQKMNFNKNIAITAACWPSLPSARPLQHRQAPRVPDSFAQNNMADIVVVFHSGYGHTQRMAQAVAEARAPTAGHRRRRQPARRRLGKLAAADAIIFGSPTYMGSVSWQFKKFADASSKPWFAQEWKDKIAAGFTNSAGMNGDKHDLTYLWTLAMQHSGLWVSMGILPTNNKAATRDSMNYVGGYGGLLTQSPSDASPAEMLKGDFETARAFGERIAQVARSRAAK